MNPASPARNPGSAKLQQTTDIEFSIVSGSREELLFDCIASIEDVLRDSPYSWTVTATCNTPGTQLAARLSQKFPSTSVIDNATPRGFAANHNTVLSRSSARYVWLLNDDVVMLPDTVELVTDYMDARGNERVGVVSPRLLNSDGTLQPSTYSFPSMPQILLAHSGLREHALTERALELAAPALRSRKGSSRFWGHDATVEVDTFRGACVAVRMSAVHEVGPMVEVAQVGAEETEWHRRFRDGGWKVVFFSGASVIHHGSQTVADGSRNLYPEYLKGALYFFRTSRPRLVFAMFCASLAAMFGTRKLIARMRGDAAGLDLARRYAAVTRDALRSSDG